MALSSYPRDDPERRTLRLHEWPEQDQQAWLAALAPVDRLEDGGAAAGWSPITKRGLVKNYGAWLSHLARSGCLDGEAAPERRVTMAAVQGYVAEMTQRNNTISVASRISALASILRVMVPATDWGWLWTIANRLRREAMAVQREHKRLVPSEAILALGLKLMAEAEAAIGLREDYRGSRYRDGLMIALLATRPLRLRNLTEFRIGRNLVPTRTGYRLLFRRSETKTGVELDLPFPDELLPALATYLTVYRPMLLVRGDVAPDLLTSLKPLPEPGRVLDGLWISTYGTMMAMPSVYLAIKTRTKAAFGFVVNPHRFRHCGVTSAAIRDADVRMSMALLGHKTTVSAQRDYNGAPATANTRHYQNSILALRESLRGKAAVRAKISATLSPSPGNIDHHDQPDARSKVPSEMQKDAGGQVASGAAPGRHDRSKARHPAAGAAPGYWRNRPKNKREQRR